MDAADPVKALEDKITKKEERLEQLKTQLETPELAPEERVRLLSEVDYLQKRIPQWWQDKERLILAGAIDAHALSCTRCTHGKAGRGQDRAWVHIPRVCLG